MITLFSVIIFLIVSDRFLKFLAVNFFGSPVELAGDFFKLNFTENYNIAFSLPIGGAGLNIAIIFIIFGLVYYLLYLADRGEYKQALFLLAVILGAASNLSDRFQYGYVVDYFDLKYFTVFNLADVLIVGGMTGLLWSLRDLDVKKEM